MHDDKTIQQQVIDELDWEPLVEPAHIGVAVDNGVVTLTGHVASYAEKRAAAGPYPQRQADQRAAQNRRADQQAELGVVEAELLLDADADDRENRPHGEADGEGERADAQDPGRARIGILLHGRSPLR